MKFDLYLVLDKIDLEILFADVLDRKKRFPDQKMCVLHGYHTSDFSKGVNPWFKLKNGI